MSSLLATADTNHHQSSIGVGMGKTPSNIQGVPKPRPSAAGVTNNNGANITTSMSSSNGGGGGGEASGDKSSNGPSPLASTSSQSPAQKRPSAPPKPAGKAPHEVKETKDVKRNRAQLPSTLIHAQPTTGDWLKKRYIVNNYILLDTLGTGSYGEVRLCKDRTTDQLFAVKIFSKDMLRKKKGGNTSETYFEDIKREIAIMKQCLHPNVLRLFEVLDDPNVNKMYLILEYMKKGDLINILKGRERRVSDPDVAGGSKAPTFQPLSDLELWNIFRQVAAGIRYLHYQNIVHGDIKPQNLLIGEDGVVKIADFGIAKMLHASGQKLADASGTPAFMSPELFDTGQAFVGQLADIWAIGATMFMLRFGHPPFVAKNIVNLSNKIQNDPLVFPVEIDAELRDLLENMLVKDPKKRLSLQQIIMHPWMRHAPLPPKAGGASGDSSTTAQSAPVQVRNKEFMPPASYDKEEQEAMKGPQALVDQDAMMMSIGLRMNRAIGKAKTTSGSGGAGGGEDGIFDADDAEDDQDDNVMATKWGEDVFELVDDGDLGGSDSEDEDQGSKKAEPVAPKGVQKDISVSSINTGLSSTKSEMSQDEEERRARRFKERLRRGSKGSNGELSAAMNGGEESKEVFVKSQASTAATTGGGGGGGGGGSGGGGGGGRDALSPASKMNKSSGNQLSSPSPSIRRKKSTPTAGGGTDGGQGEQDDEEYDQLSMEEFGRMMDTLALQPRLDEIDTKNPVSLTLRPANFSAQLRNMINGVGAAFHSEQGKREQQEDRCILLPDVAAMRALEGYDLEPMVRETLRKFSIACVFDGHSGWRCAQYLSQYFVSSLVLHEKFLDKHPEVALVETCRIIDEQVCALLRKEDNSSGSTGVIAVYDGRRHLLTVANVGDSMCILSRGGRAVKLHRMHRLGPDDLAERERVQKAGASVVNNRVGGVLAISRAFGDTQFKEVGRSIEQQPVIAVPDIVSEIITPMTEFGVIATDGLFDVMGPQLVINFVRKFLSKKSDLQETARELVQEALARGSVDNVTVLIISFHMNATATSGGAKSPDAKSPPPKVGEGAPSASKEEK